jgi:hypothetical protein
MSNVEDFTAALDRKLNSEASAALQRATAQAAEDFEYLTGAFAADQMSFGEVDEYMAATNALRRAVNRLSKLRRAVEGRANEQR